MKDVVGRDLAIGDQIAYCTRAGSSMDLIVAEVLAVDGARIKVQPSLKSRNSIEYYDERTGEIITDLSTEIKAPAYYKSVGTDPDLTVEEFRRQQMEQYRGGPIAQGKYLSQRYHYVQRELNDYVKVRRALSAPVYLRTSYYIVKLEAVNGD